MQFEAKHFNPLRSGGVPVGADGTVAFRSGAAPTDMYLYKQEAVLALNVALATGRPLLVSGEPGSGKSSLARNAADVLGWRYYDKTITSRTQASDLLWSFDALQRLNDATTPDTVLPDKEHFVDPETLWWAFNPRSAAMRGAAALPADKQAPDPGIPGRLHQDKVVVLLDEIDKADPDVPNDLLEPFDRSTFLVRETKYRVQRMEGREILLVLTTNGERELPPAFLRRCVTLTLAAPTPEWFATIADHKFGTASSALHKAVAAEVMLLRGAAKRAGVREPSTAEYLDALQVCRDLGIDTKSEAWTSVTRAVLWKSDREPDVDREATDSGDRVA
jgi:MoxR-like ATPase